MNKLHQIVFAATAMLALAAPLSAQQSQPLPLQMAALSSAEATLAPVALALPSATSAAAPAATSLVFNPPATAEAVRFEAMQPAALLAPSSQSVAMMIVGGAGLVVGAVIGGDPGTIIMIGGGGLALLGLYQYLR